MNAEIMRVKGGARAIATMTFDDGHPRTSRKLNELLAKYGAHASLMLYCRKSLRSEEEIDLWRDMLAPGYLSAENHSMTHDYLTSNPNYTKPEHLCEEKYVYETEESQRMIRDAFPGSDVLSFTIPYANYVLDARKHVIRTHYAALAGECVLTDRENVGMMQSLDPAYADPETGKTPAGSWHNVYYARLQPIYSRPREGEDKAIYPELTMDNIIGYLDRCVSLGGWFITSCHGIYQGENQDLTEEDMELLLSAMHEHAKENKLWIASFSEATKYVRERQNSTLSIRECDGAYYVSLTMKEETPDGLSLKITKNAKGGDNEPIFNMPLTVRIELPERWDAVKYTQGENTFIADSFIEDKVRYAYLELVPNGGEARVVRA